MSSDGSKKTTGKGIQGKPPSLEGLNRVASVLAREFALYPPSFWEKIRCSKLLFCEALHYEGQKRDQVPHLVMGVLYIDCGPCPASRLRHSFHHELWHFADFCLLGPKFEHCKDDKAWNELNPVGFSYGVGGAVMREDSTAGYIAAPHPEFLNRYSTSSIAEDKAEVWAALCLYREKLQASNSLQKKGQLLKDRSVQLCPAVNSSFWQTMLDAAAEHAKYATPWEQYTTDAGRPWWFNTITYEKSWKKPAVVTEMEQRMAREKKIQEAPQSKTQASLSQSQPQQPGVPQTQTV